MREVPRSFPFILFISVGVLVVGVNVVCPINISSIISYYISLATSSILYNSLDLNAIFNIIMNQQEMINIHFPSYNIITYAKATKSYI